MGGLFLAQVVVRMVHLLVKFFADLIYQINSTAVIIARLDRTLQGMINRNASEKMSGCQVQRVNPLEGNYW